MNSKARELKKHEKQLALAVAEVERLRDAGSPKLKVALKVQYQQMELLDKLNAVSTGSLAWWIRVVQRSIKRNFYIVGAIRQVFKINFIRDFAHRVVPVSVKTAMLNRINGTKNDQFYADGFESKSRKFGSRRQNLANMVPDLPQYNFVLFCSIYPGEGRGYGGGFIRSRVEAYSKNGFKTLVIEINSINVEIGFSEAGSAGCLRIPPEDLSFYLSQISALDVKVLTHSPSPAILSAISKKIEDKRCVHWFHGFEVRDYRRLFFNYATPEMEKLRQTRDETHGLRREAAIKVFAQEGSAKVFVSKFLKLIAERDTGQIALNAHVIPNYIDSEHYSFRPKKSEQAKNILLIRTFQTRNYANDIAISAIKILSTRQGFDKLQFTICGAGDHFVPLTDQLAQLENVDIREGYLSATQMQKLHAESGIFLVPSRFDTQGVVMGEAMASGLVCITSNIAAIPEYADDNCAVLVRPDDAQAYADAIWSLIESPQQLPTLSKAAGQRVRKQCGFENTIMRELELISGKTP